MLPGRSVDFKPQPVRCLTPRKQTARQSRLGHTPKAILLSADASAVSQTDSLIRSLPGINFTTALGLGVATSIYKKLFRRRRARHRASKKMQPGNGKAIFSVATFNVRGIMDRWHERAPILKQCLEEMDADVICFQECLTGEYGQDKQVLNESYHTFSCKAALFNLLQDSGVLRLYAKLCSSMLNILPFQRLMVRIPAPLEQIREKFTLRSSLFRMMRDMAMAPFFGNSIACRLADAHEIKHSTLILGDWRAAQRIEFALGDGNDDESTDPTDTPRPHARVNGDRGDIKIWVVNTHLDHEHPDNRQRQALQVATWMDDVRNDAAAVVLCGDFNGNPSEPFHQLLTSMGYRSAYKVKHGREPEGTWPTGIQAPLMDHGPYETLDYVYVWAAEGYEVKILDAQVFGNHPSKDDKTLYPSDHAAVKATIELRSVRNVVVPKDEK